MSQLSDPKQDEHPLDDAPDEIQDVDLLEKLFPMETSFPMVAPILFSK